MFLIFCILFDNIFSSKVQAASFIRGGVDQTKCELSHKPRRPPNARRFKFLQIRRLKKSPFKVNLRSSVSALELKFKLRSFAPFKLNLKLRIAANNEGSLISARPPNP